MLEAVSPGESYGLDGGLLNLIRVLDVQIQASAVQTVPGSASSVNITGNFALPYQVLALPDWNTNCWYSVHSSTQITINFSSPSPSGGGLLHYMVTGPSGSYVIIAASTVATVANVDSITVPGQFPNTYAVAVGLSWGGIPLITSSTPSSFSIGFSSPPSSGGYIDYIVVAPSGTAVTNTINGNTLSISSGTTTVSLTGSYVTPYQVFAFGSWPGSPYSSNKGVGTNSVSFLDPGSSATLDYVIVQPATQIVSGVQQTLASYLLDVRALLRDPDPGNTYLTSDLTRFINRAIRQRDLDLGMNRSKFLFYLTVQQASYTYSQIMQTAQLLNGNPLLQIMDVLSFIVMPLGGIASSVRYPLGRKAYSALSPFISTSYPTYPTWYGLYGPTTLFVAPPPANAYPCEIDFVGYSPDLVNDTDMDYMPYPYTDPVPFLACAFAKETLQRFDEAKVFAATYEERMLRFRAGSRRMSVSNPWSFK